MGESTAPERIEFRRATVYPHRVSFEGPEAITLDVCNECDAVVLDPVKHREWHARQAA